MAWLIYSLLNTLYGSEHEILDLPHQQTANPLTRMRERAVLQYILSLTYTKYGSTERLISKSKPLGPLYSLSWVLKGGFCA